MEQYHKLHKQIYKDNEELTKEMNQTAPVVVVHCKAGKGRTGMMICSLLVFLGMFKTHKEAIDHYNEKRAKNKKALTINSQKRYVKFFCGFLHYKLREEGNQKEKEMTFFELSLRKHNYLTFNRVFEDMRNEVVDFHSICLGPFTAQLDFNIILSYMKKDTIEPIFNYDDWVKRLHNNYVEEGENSLVKQVREWKSVKVEKNGVTLTQWYLILNLHRLDQKVWGDFKVQFKSHQASFYFWLNVSAILYNSELKQISKNENFEDPIHFEEFEEIEEAEIRTGNLKNYLYSLLPESNARHLSQEDEDNKFKKDTFDEDSHFKITMQQLLSDQKA